MSGDQVHLQDQAHTTTMSRSGASTRTPALSSTASHPTLARMIAFTLSTVPRRCICRRLRSRRSDASWSNRPKICSFNRGHRCLRGFRLQSIKLNGRWKTVKAVTQLTWRESWALGIASITGLQDRPNLNLIRALRASMCPWLRIYSSRTPPTTQMEHRRLPRSRIVSAFNRS